MNNVSVSEFFDLIASYNLEELEFIKKVYYYAEDLHSGQTRKSGEPYIIHPLNVAYILANIKADRDTVCAGILHDILEDTDVVKEELAREFNPTIAQLVDGVTKLKRINFSSKNDQVFANTRKIITGIMMDPRIIIIKLADRLHNMQTLQFLPVEKQIDNAQETLSIFMPLAYYIGAYAMKCELEDLSLMYLDNDTYKRLYDERLKLEEDNMPYLEEMLNVLHKVLDSEGISNDVKIRTKNIYGLYRNELYLKSGNNYGVSNIHDCFSLRVVVDEILDCYKSLYFIHKEYHPINEMFKDYICSPKGNMYQSLHSTVFGLNDKLVQMQIRTHQMNQIATFGLASYWYMYKGDAKRMMLEDFKNKCNFYKSLDYFDKLYGDNEEFVSKVKGELFTDRVYVYTKSGEMYEMPVESTIIDFAYSIGDDIGNKMVAATVNDEVVDLSYKLKNWDRVRVITDDMAYGPNDEWVDIAKTARAKRKIKEYKNVCS